MPIDKKYKIEATNMHTGEKFTENHGMFFKFSDAAFALTLDDYKRHCTELDCEPKHIEDINYLLHSVKAWQALNPHKVKRPD